MPNNFLLYLKILMVFFLVIFSPSNFIFASEVEDKKCPRKTYILEEEKNRRVFLEAAQELWVREKFSPEIKQVSLGIKDIVVEEENGMTWISANGELTCFPVNIILKEIMVSKQFPFLEFQRDIPNIDLKQRGVILTFLNEKNDSVGFVKMFMLKKIPQQKPIQIIWSRK